MSNEVDRDLWDDTMKTPKAPKEIVWYLHDKKGQLRGAVAKTIDGRFGFSWAHKNDVKKITKKRTRMIALERAKKCDIHIAYDVETRETQWVRERGPLGWVTRIPHEVQGPLTELAMKGAKVVL